MTAAISPSDGTNGADTLIGSSAAEVLSGRSGNDAGWVGIRDDLINGNSGNDTIYEDTSPKFAGLRDIVIT